MPSTRPNIAFILGWGGIIPFVASATLVLFADPFTGIMAANMGSIYGGFIIAFLGAVHWGAVMGGAMMGSTVSDSPQNWRYIWSVMPALAMTAIAILPPLIKLPLMMLSLGICWAIDLYTTQRGGFPTWYMQMRHGLTAVAIISLGIMWSA